MYVFCGPEMDCSKPQFNEDPVNVLAFKSAEGDFFFLCARDPNNVVLQV